MLRIAVTSLIAVTCGITGAPSRAAAGGAQVAQEFLLRSGAAGPIEVGQAVDQVFARVGRENTRLVDLFTEGMFNPALEIRMSGADTQPAITVPIREWPCAEFSVWGIAVRDRRFRTREGLGIGSTPGEIKKAHKPELDLAEGERAAYVSELGVTFMLDDSTGSSDSWPVKYVWVVPQPVQVRQTRCPALGPLQTGARRLTRACSRRRLVRS